ncbi:MAG: hypothetical protein KH216_07540, partial [Clostridiales bacterium]|nr:hypothetical protein [Clostridiales bacterium]
ISIDTIGLIKGITSFDPSKGTRLATYASRCVDNPIQTQRLCSATMGNFVCRSAKI